MHHNKNTVSIDEHISDAIPPSSDEKLPSRVTLVVGLLLSAAFVVILNETIMSVALPSLVVDLDITAATAQWLTTA